MRFRQRDHAARLTAQQRRVGTAVAEHRLVRVACDDGDFGARRQHPDQPGGLRIEVLRVVDQQHLDSAAFSRQQRSVRRERLESGPDQFGGAQAGTVACGAAIPTAERSSMTCS